MQRQKRQGTYDLLSKLIECFEFTKSQCFS